MSGRTNDRLCDRNVWRPEASAQVAGAGGAAQPAEATPRGVRSGTIIWIWTEKENAVAWQTSYRVRARASSRETATGSS